MRIKEAFEKRGQHVRIRGTRFIPSTKVELGPGTFQVMANAVVEVAGAGGGPDRPRAFDTVLTVGRRPKAGQVLEKVEMPVLDF